VAKEMGLTVVPGISVSAMDENFGPLGNQRSIVRSFEDDSKYSKRFEVANVIARVKNIDDSGLVALTQAKPYVEPILKNKKKAELIKAKMTGSSMEAIAKSAGSTVLQLT
jgi:peptidyl-prolyl cis-trans isomerase D